MIRSLHSEFLSPTKKSRRLSVLLAIHDAPESSQHTIGKNTRMSSSMVNNYIKQLKGEGLITISGDTNRTQSYHLTADGQQMLRGSLLHYSADIVQLYGSVKREIAKILSGFYEEGVRTVVLFGAAETAEVVHLAIKKTHLVVIGVVDSDAKKHGKPFNGLLIQSPEEVRRIQPDAVIITSFARQEEIHKYLKKRVGKKIKIKKLSDLKRNGSHK
jgi:DNA-binding MarR family transcriptional regulator